MIEKRFEQLMRARGYKTAYQLAKATGLTEEGLKKLLNGKTNGISFETLDRLCEALKCKVGQLLVYRRSGNKKADE